MVAIINTSSCGHCTLTENKVDCLGGKNINCKKIFDLQIKYLMFNLLNKDHLLRCIFLLTK